MTAIYALQGLCEQLGVHGREVSATAQPLAVRFAGENAEGDGVRRDWISTASAELLNPEFGLFSSSDGFRTISPNPHTQAAPSQWLPPIDTDASVSQSVSHLVSQSGILNSIPQIMLALLRHAT